jgi:hypothetical protein
MDLFPTVRAEIPIFDASANRVRATCERWERARSGLLPGSSSIGKRFILLTNDISGLLRGVLHRCDSPRIIRCS